MGGVERRKVEWEGRGENEEVGEREEKWEREGKRKATEEGEKSDQGLVTVKSPCMCR